MKAGPDIGAGPLFELSDKQWAIIAPLLRDNSRGVPHVLDRKSIKRDFLVLLTRAQWEYLLERYGRA